jgi:hypothetical protein
MLMPRIKVISGVAYEQGRMNGFMTVAIIALGGGARFGSLVARVVKSYCIGRRTIL